MTKQTLKVDSDHAQLRLDVFLTKNLTDIPSRTFIKRLIDDGQVSVNEKIVKAHYKVSVEDQVVIHLPDQEAPIEHIAPENIPLNIFYQDEVLLVINKPAGMLVHPVPGCSSGTLVNALLHYCQSETNAVGAAKKKMETAEPVRSLSDVNSSFRPGIVHRLDRETSGLILIAKDNRTHVQLAKAFEHHRVKKQYVALVQGKIEFDQGVIDARLGRHPTHWDKKAVALDEEDGREARTFYQVRQRFEKKATLVALFPESGRTHQLRVHMAHLGHPVLGDDKYGMRNSFPRLALHAQGIGFVHPQTKQFVEFFCPCPPEFLKGVMQSVLPEAFAG